MVRSAPAQARSTTVIMLTTPRAGYEHRVVPISGLLVCDNPKVTLGSHSVGMGLVVAAYDPVAHVGGMYHAMLPEAVANPARARERPGMFVDVGFDTLNLTLRGLGAVTSRLVYFAAGGAQVMGACGSLNIGLRNTQTLRRLLADSAVTLVGENLGGHTCRSFYLGIESGEASVLLSGQLNEISLCLR